MNNYIVAVFAVLILFGFAPLSHSQIIGNADVLLTDVYIEPADPQPGDSVSIKSLIYNAGLQSTKSVTDVVTVGYFVNGDLVKIDELPNIEPGIENGILLSSGPVWNASEGNITVTVILNYHNTLSPLTDNLSNNIIQRIFSIGDPRPSVVLFEIFQEYIPHTKTQQIRLEGDLTSSLSNNLFLPDNVSITIDKFHDVVPVDSDGLFQFSKEFPLFDDIVPVTITVEEVYPLLGSQYTENIYPIQLETDSVLSFQIQNPSESYNFLGHSTTVAIFDESYNLVKEIETDDLSLSEKTYDIVFTTVPNGTYITEIYFEGRFLHAITTNLQENEINTSSILFPETSKVKFQILSHAGEAIPGALVQNWIFESTTDENGFTDWIDVLPTLGTNDPYAAKVLLPNEKIFWSDSFFMDHGEQKVIQMVINP